LRTSELQLAFCFMIATKNRQTCPTCQTSLTCPTDPKSVIKLPPPGTGN
jgi:hypothetical protein